MQEDFRPPLTIDPAKRIAELEAENVQLRTGFKASIRFGTFGITSFFCISLVAVMSPWLSTKGISSFYILTVFIILGSLLSLNYNFVNSRYTRILISRIYILRWLLVPVILTIITVLLTWYHPAKG